MTPRRPSATRRPPPTRPAQTSARYHPLWGRPTSASKLYFITWPASLDEVLTITDQSVEQHVWSPDGKSLLLVTRQIVDAQYRLRFSVINVSTQTQIPALGFDWVSESYLLLQPVFWLP